MPAFYQAVNIIGFQVASCVLGVAPRVHGEYFAKLCALKVSLFNRRINCISSLRQQSEGFYCFVQWEENMEKCIRN